MHAESDEEAQREKPPLVIRPSPSLTPLIPSLPDELAEKILLLVAGEAENLASWAARMQRCCRRWYWYIEGNPMFWTQITEKPPPRLWAAYLQKSQDKKLQVYCTAMHSPRHHSMLYYIQGVMNRVEVLHCTTPEEHAFLGAWTGRPPEPLRTLYDTPVMTLKELHLDVQGYQSYHATSLFDGIAPQLRDVKLTNVSIPWTLLLQAPMLESVVLEWPPNVPTPVQVRDFLIHCPRLIKFHMNLLKPKHHQHAGPPATMLPLPWSQPHNPPTAPIVMRYIQSFVVKAVKVQGLHYVLDQLFFPPNATIDILIDDLVLLGNSDGPNPLTGLFPKVFPLTSNPSFKFCITAQTTDIYSGNVAVRFPDLDPESGRFCCLPFHQMGTYKDYLTAVVIHRSLGTKKMEDFFQSVTSAMPSIPKLEYAYQSGTLDLLVTTCNRLANLQTLTLRFERAGDRLEELPEVRRAMNSQTMISGSNLNVLTEVSSKLPHLHVTGYEVE